VIQAKIDPKYEVLKKLREGGMGAIYLVRHRLLDELRVIKVLRSQLTADEDLKQRFLREARIAIQLRHPNVAQLYDFSIDDEGTAYIVLEYIDGITLEEYARQPEARHLPLTLAIAQQGLRALGYLHRKGFVHRDIAPDNLMLTKDVDGEPLVKLIDLGIVKILKGEGKGTATSLYLGKPKYSSPEQLVSQDIDARSDLYSFGVLLYELVTGVYPIHGHDLPSLITGHLHREPIGFDVSDPGGTVPEALRQLVLRALAKRPEDRFASAEEFSKLLAEVAAALAPSAHTEERALLDAARQGAHRERLEALAAAERAVRDRIDQRDFAAAREQLSQAVERLGNDTKLAELLRAIESEERGQRQASAESERLAAMADAAERALDGGDLPDAMSKVFEILARAPQHPRGKALQERIDRLRRDQEAVAGGAPTAATVLAGRAAAAATAAAATPRVIERPAAPVPLAPDEVTAPVQVAGEAAVDGGAPRRSSAAMFGVAAVAAGVAVAGWLLWRALAAPAPPALPAPTPTPTAESPNVAATYGAGVAALERGDAAEAARRLREALAADPAERDGYYPRAQYGRALAALGDCAGAESAFAASEAAGVATRAPLWAAVGAARAACAQSGAGGRFDDDLAVAEDDLQLVLGQLAELRRQKTQPGVAQLWAENPSFGAQEKQVENLVAEAERALAAARARRDPGQVFEASDRTADARSLLKKLLAAAADAAGRAAASS